MSYVNILDALCATGKTEAACRFISKNQYWSNYLYVVPTKKLGKEVQDRLKTMGVDALRVDGDHYPDGVQKNLIPLIKEAPEVGTVIICTHQTYFSLAYFHRRDNWNVIIDEVPQIDTAALINDPADLDVIRQWIRPERNPAHPGMGYVTPTSAAGLAKFLKRERDNLPDHVRNMLWNVLNPNYTVHLEAMSSLDSDLSQEDQAPLFVSMLNRKALEGATVLGANIADSMFAGWCQTLGLELRPHEEMAKLLLGPGVAGGERLKLHYFYERKGSSKWLLGKTTKDGALVCDEMDRAAASFFGNEPTLTLVNKNRATPHLGDNFVRLSGKPHGSNEYRNYHNVYIAAAYNRSPRHGKMLQRLGISKEVQRKSTFHEACYQVIYRSSIRAHDSDHVVRCILPDRASCEYIQNVVPGSTIAALPWDHEKRPLSNSDKKRRQRLNQRLEGWLAAKPDTMEVQSSETLEAHVLDLTQRDKPLVFCTFHDEVRNATEATHQKYDFRIGVFKRLFQSMAKTVWRTKAEGRLFNPSLFAPQGGKGYRKNDYFVASSMLVLDFDGGEVSPQEFERIFVSDKLRHPFLIANTFSTSATAPNKFRVIVFYKTPARSLDEHAACFDYVEDILKEHGHLPGRSGLDMASRKAGQSYYFPCTNSTERDSAFFRAFGATEKQVKRYGLEPACLLERLSSPEIKKPRF